MSNKKVKQPLGREGKSTSFLDLPVQVDGKASTLTAKLEFDRAKGLGKFTVTAHSKHLSLEEGEQEYFLQCWAAIGEAAYGNLLEMIREYYAAEGEVIEQPHLFEEAEIQELNEAKSKRGRPSKAQVVAKPSSDG